ncbi:MAG: hypothetical protein E7379_02440 [Clostridiales bacterium]|nr:hypothetical protein [Clostridiales bacterium]
MAYSQDDVLVLSISAGIIVFLSVFAGIFMRNKSERIKQIPSLIITIILLALELAKQMLSIFEGYNLWNIPLHFCSTYFIWFSLANFSKGKFAQGMKSVAFVASFYLVAMFYFNPQSIIGNATSDLLGSFYNFHTFAFHHLVILYFCLNVALLNFNFKFIHVLYWCISMLTYYGIAVLCAHLFEVNFMNILYSNIPFMENLRLTIGQVGYTIILGSLTIGVGAVIILFASLINKKLKEKKEV